VALLHQGGFDQKEKMSLSSTIDDSDAAWYFGS
jgi:hypothetical protein